MMGGKGTRKITTRKYVADSDGSGRGEGTTTINITITLFGVDDERIKIPE